MAPYHWCQRTLSCGLGNTSNEGDTHPERRLSAFLRGPLSSQDKVSVQEPKSDQHRVQNTRGKITTSSLKGWLVFGASLSWCGRGIPTGLDYTLIPLEAFWGLLTKLKLKQTY